MGEERPTPQDQIRQLYEESESRTAAAMEQLVGRQSFGELLARVTENVMSVTRIGNDVLDLAVRNLRLAGRQDVTRLARQLARTEDKLEMVLQEVERLEERLASDAADRDGGAGAARPAAGRRSRSSSSKSSGNRSKAGGRGRGNSGSGAGSGSSSGSRSGSGSGSGSGSSSDARSRSGS